MDIINPGMFLPTLQTEYAVYGSLGSFLSTWDLAYFFKRRLILDTAEGLWALHQCSVIHGDMKVDNILIFPHDDETFPFIAKLSDFGFSMDTCTARIISTWLEEHHFGPHQRPANNF